MAESLPLSNQYQSRLSAMLRAIGQRSGVEPDELTGFWPRVGQRYERRLLVVGKAVNGWIDKVERTRLAVPADAAAFAQALRTTASHDECPMRWVTDAWGRSGDYNTARSAFWRFARAALVALDAEAARDPSWSGRLAWTNLAKVAPWSGGNPAGKLLDIQREFAPSLFAEEVSTFDPHTVLVATGRWWFEPFAEALRLDVDWRDGGVAGYAESDGRRYVIGPHPQGKSREVVGAVLELIKGHRESNGRRAVGASSHSASKPTH